MIDSELTRLRLNLASAYEDPKALYHYRLDALRAGYPVDPLPGDKVKTDGEEYRVVRVEEMIEGPERLTLKNRESGEYRFAYPDEVKIVSPHRPAALLGVSELEKRLSADLAERDEGLEVRVLETLGEMARRGLPEAIEVALELLGRMEGPPSQEMHGALRDLLRSRAPGEVEVALRKEGLADRPEVALPSLAACAPDEDAAREVLDRLEVLPPETIRTVAQRAGRWLCGAGGPGFVQAEIRERVATLAREHPDADVRRDLFIYAARPLMPDELLVAALTSESAEVRSGAQAELIRRGSVEPVWEHARREEDPGVLCILLRDSTRSPHALPLDVLQRFLTWPGEEGLAPLLRRLAFLRIPELEDAEAAFGLLAPHLEKAPNEDDELQTMSIWCAGLLGKASASQNILRLVQHTESLPRQALGLEALARLGDEQAARAVYAWGVPILREGLWGEEVIDCVGLLLGHRVDPQELAARFTISPPGGPVRRARALDVARALLEGRQENVAVRLARPYTPSRLRRFRDLEERLPG